MRYLVALILVVFAGNSPVRDGPAGVQDEKPALTTLPKLGEKFLPRDVDMARPVYETSFDSPEVLKGWRLEGGKRMSIADGCLILESDPTKKGKDGKCIDHLVCWLSKELPADFLIEFAVRPANRKEGLNIVFFNARGVQGKSIFDPHLNTRDGTYKQYHSGDLNCYHISYWAAGRGTANLRKSKGFHLVAEGKDLICDAPADAFQTVRVYKGARHNKLTHFGVVGYRGECTMQPPSNGLSRSSPNWRRS